MNWKNSINRLLSHLLPILLLAGCLAGEPLEPLRTGDPAKAFSLTLSDGSSKTLADYQGKGLVMTFMASWCPCSNDSIPMFQAAYAHYGKKIAFLMVGIQEAQSKFEKFVVAKKIPYATGFDTTHIARSYGINSPPTTVFIDKDGKVKRFFYGNIKDVENDFPGWVAEVL